MDLGLTALIIIALIAVFVFWYLAKSNKYLGPDVLIQLDGEDDKLVTAWYQAHITDTDVITFDEKELLATILEQFYNIKADKSWLIIGKNLKAQYRKLTGKSLTRKNWFNLRDKFAIDAEIAIIKERNLRKSLEKANKYDCMFLAQVYNNNLLTTTEQYITAILRYRWGKLEPYFNSNSGGSYLYTRLELPNIQGYKMSDSSYRYNLLCSNIEFETMILRLEQSLDQSLEQSLEQNLQIGNVKTW